MKMMQDKKLDKEDYNYPIAQFYRHAYSDSMKGAETKGRMAVEYGVLLRIEFIPEGAKSGPVKEIYFKIFKKGSSGIVGAVLGWPCLDYPNAPGGEGLGWRNQTGGCEYTVLGVTLPRLDDTRKSNYSMADYR